MSVLPSSIRVGYRTYHIVVLSPMQATGKDVFGECDNSCGEIRIRSDIDPVKQANTMLHEVLHACWFVAGLNDDDREERTVNTLANQLTQVWRDNPDLVAWVDTQLGGAK